MPLRCRVLRSSMLISIASMRRSSNETQSSHYYDRLYKSYPIRRRCLTDFVRTGRRWTSFSAPVGCCKYMAIVIHRLWVADNRDAADRAGSLPLMTAMCVARAFIICHKAGSRSSKRGGWLAAQKRRISIIKIPVLANSRRSQGDAYPVFGRCTQYRRSDASRPAG